MIDPTQWQDAVQSAWAYANSGRPEDAFDRLTDAATSPPTDPELSPIFHISAIHGQHHRALPLALRYLTRESPVLANRHCNAWAIEVLRKAGQFEELLVAMLGFAPDQVSIPLFYAHVAAALHDEAFLSHHEGDPRLEKLFAMAVEQAHASGPAMRSEFIFMNAFTYTSAPQLYGKLFPIHRRLMAAVDADLRPSKNVFLARLQLNLGERIEGTPLVQSLTDATAQEMFAVWSTGKDRLADLMRHFYIDGSFETAARDLAPQIILTFEKLYSGMPDTAMRLIVEDWVDRIPQRYNDTLPADLPMVVLDQLVLIHRWRRPDIFEWYIARRPEPQALEELKLLKTTFSAAAPRLSLERKPRIGVCISGQLRGYTQAHPTVMQHLLADVEPVIFVDTWQKIGRKAPTPAQAWRLFSGAFLTAYQSLANAMGYPGMCARYPKLTQLDDASSVDVPELAQFYGCPETHIRVEDDEAGVFTKFSNPQKMYHKIRGAQNLLEQSGIEVDAVLRMRPDKSLNGLTLGFDWHHLIDVSHNDRVFYADFPARTHPTSGLVIGDQAGIGSMELMQIYAQAEATTLEAGTLDWTDWPAKPRAHSNLSHALWINGVKVSTMPVRWGKMYDPDTLTPQDVLALLDHDLADRTPDANDARLLAAARQDLQPR